MAYSLDFRRRVLAIKEEENLTQAQTGSRFKIGTATLQRWIKNIEPKTNRYKAPTKINMEALSKDVQEYPDAYLYERAQRFGVTPEGIAKALRRLGVTYKKNSKASKSQFRKKVYVLPDDKTT